MMTGEACTVSSQPVSTLAEVVVEDMDNLAFQNLGTFEQPNVLYKASRRELSVVGLEPRV